jgi:hypothetical protein
MPYTLISFLVAVALLPIIADADDAAPASKRDQSADLQEVPFRTDGPKK